jgi:hypothetical protein
MLVLFLEILNQEAKDYWLIFTICTPISMFFLVYAYALVMNAKAARLLRARETDFQL